MNERPPGETASEKLNREITELETHLARVLEQIAEIKAEQQRYANGGVSMSLKDGIVTQRTLNGLYYARNELIEGIATKKMELQHLTVSHE